MFQNILDLVGIRECGVPMWGVCCTYVATGGRCQDCRPQNTIFVFFASFTGYAFLLFRDEVAVHRLVKNCVMDEGKLFMFVSSVTQTNKKVVTN